MLTESEKRELREMAASVPLREEFRAMQQNSRALEGRVSVDELIRWLTAMGRAFPAPAKPRPVSRYTNVKI